MKRIKTRLPISIMKPLLPPALALRKVTSRSGNGVYASSDTLFKGAIFGRDSIEVAEDLLLVKPRLTRRIILTLARLQGEISDDKSEEDPGKIIHEYRSAHVDGRKINDTSQHILKILCSLRSHDPETLAYYGSIDATPHFIRLVGAFTDRYGDNILNKRVKLRSGHTLSLKLVVENALDWLLTQLATSRSGLLEYHRRNPNGIENQVWKDSLEFYVHADGKMVNLHAPIASIEVQALVYDALIVASELFPDKARELINRARDVRDTTIKLLWQEKRHYFALGTDYDEHGKLRPIATLTANPAALLDSRFFDELPLDMRKKYISGIVHTILSDEFLTDAGIRSRALRESKLINYWDYHGSFTTWPKETYDIAKGLRRQGCPTLARELENRLLNVVLKNKAYPEVVYVNSSGRVFTTSPNPHTHSNVVLVDGTHQPERIQAWTVSAIVAIVSHRLNSKLRRIQKARQETWQHELELRLLGQMPRVNRLFSPRALAARYPTQPYILTKTPQTGIDSYVHRHSG